ncbi:MAG TPA: tetratricopeptide repeat protein [Thermoanaerobaculia bacterium]|nr:tetratricopeptide repeat protein [Thermoanaerobaculia bacterium]
MQVSYVLGLAFTAAAAVDAVRRGRTQWLWIILIFPTLGALIYFVAEYALGGMQGMPRFVSTLRPVSGRELEEAASNVRRLDTANAWTEYAALLRRRGKAAEALAAAGTAVERDGESAEARYELGRSLFAAGRPKEAVPELQKGLARNRFVENGEGLLTLAQAEDQSGDKSAALATLKELTGRHVQPPFLWELARLQAETGDPAAAKATLERLVDDAQYVPRYLRGSVRPWVGRAKKRLRELG